MTKNTVKIEAKTNIENNSLQRFLVFVATGKHPLISSSNFVRAERLAIIFARLTNARMEVFDSEKEICYFVEPSEANRLSIH